VNASENVAIRELARELDEALKRFAARGGRECVAGCTCPMSETIRCARWFIACLGKLDGGGLLAPADGLPLGDDDDDRRSGSPTSSGKEGEP